MICDCGEDKGYRAYQTCYHDVLVNSKGHFIEDCGIGDSEKPTGPFECAVCGRTYEYLED